MTDKIGVDDFFAAGGDGASLAAAAVAFDVWADGDGKEPKIGLIKELADSITGSEHFAQNNGGKLYRFSDGVYTPRGSEFVKRCVRELLEDREQTANWSSHLA